MTAKKSKPMILRWENRNIENVTGTNIYRSNKPMNYNRMPPRYDFVEGNLEEYIDSEVYDNEQYYYRLGTVYNDIEMISSEILRFSREEKFLYFASSDNHVYKINEYGDIKWDFRHGSNANDIVIDDNGDSYSCSNDRRVRKLSFSGDIEWEFSGHSQAVNSISLSGDHQYLYSGSSDNTLRKIDATTGEEIWSYSTGSTIRVVESDYASNIYIGCSDRSLRKIDRDGNILWFRSYDGLPTDIKINLEFNKFISFDDNKIVKLGSDDSTEWVYEHINPVTKLSIDDKNFLYVGDDQANVFKLSNSRNILWWNSYVSNDPISGMSIGENNFLYISFSGQVKKLSLSNGNSVWEKVLSRESIRELSSKRIPVDENIMFPPLSVSGNYISEPDIEYSSVDKLYPPLVIRDNYISDYEVEYSSIDKLYPPLVIRDNYISDYEISFGTFEGE